MRARAGSIRWFLTCTIVLALGLVVAGCGNDPYSTPLGSFIIELEPGTVDAPWRVVGEHGLSVEGHGDRSVVGLPSGSYTVVWLDAWGWAAPAPQVVEVTSVAEPVVTGTYRRSWTVMPDTPDRLMENLSLAYTSRSLSLYANLIHPEHVTLLQRTTIDAFPELGSRLEVAEERRIHRRMFSGEDLVDPDGLAVPAINHIWMSLWRQSEWTLAPPADPIPGVLCAIYNVSVSWERTWPLTNLHSQGEIRFYVTSQDTVVSGVVLPRYRLRGQVDKTRNEAGNLEMECWGTVKAGFR